MGLNQFDEELRSCLIDGLGTLFVWIHNNANAPASQAKTAIKTWLDNNYPQFATNQFGDAVVDRVLGLYDGTWVTFRDNTNGYRLAIKDIWVREVLKNAVT